MNRLDMLHTQRPPVKETAEDTVADSADLGGPVTISTVIVLRTQNASWAHRVVLLSCVVLIDLAIYVTVARETSGDQWMNPLPEKILTDVTGLLPTALTASFMFNGLESE
jgi:small neutral amino acid transporter SnatA (MarC family)